MNGYAQDEEVARFPSKPITWIDPYPPGSSSGIAANLLAPIVEKLLGQPIVYVNRPGAAGTVGVAAIAKAKPDGYTIGNTPHSPLLITPHLQKLPYHPVRDLQMIMQIGAFNMGVIVRSDAPFKSFKDIVAYARQNPNKVTYGTAGTNSMQNILMEQIAKKEKVQITHIPFKATVEAQTALLGGHVLFAAGDFNYSLFESGDVRLLVLLKEERSVEYPKIPLLKDIGYDIPFPTFMTVSGPKGIPTGIVKRLEEAFAKGLRDPAFVKGMADARIPIVYRSSKELSDYVASNYESYGKVLTDMGVKK
jgi:tripartite-type tricarboxylate transporter receptor subunit TctC